MGFKLTGYEKDNIGIFSFAIYTFFGCLSFIIVIVLVNYYFLIEKESVYLDTLTRGTDHSKEYKRSQMEILNKHNIIPINDAITKTVEFYND